MQNLLKLEEIGEFLLSVFLFSTLPFSWWLFPLLLFTPDISMAGYAVNNKTGAILYNLFHHRLMAIAWMLVGFYWNMPTIGLIGVILFGHAAMDRIFGFGLKYTDHFKHTHLGWMDHRP